MFLLDTNIVSLLDARRQKHVLPLIEWIERNGAFLYLSMMTVAEVEAGILKLKRERKLQRANELTLFLQRVLADFGDHVLPMDALTAITVAQLSEEARPHVVELADLIIAATARRHGLTLLTANTRHFERLAIPLINPLESLPDDVSSIR